MPKRIGIDAGGSLIKVVYEEEGKFHYKAVPVNEMTSFASWIKTMAPEANFFVTGGKRRQFAELAEIDATFVGEFEAATRGARFLLKEQDKTVPDPFILVNIGTGTSIFYVSGDQFERVLGTGIGGGTLLGLGSLITGTRDYSRLIDLAKEGKRENCDLLVKDIYFPDIPPLGGDLTASNFGKVPFATESSKSDLMASLIQMMGETLLTFAIQVAQMKQTGNIVFAGGTLNGNQPLMDVLTMFTNLLPYKPVFLEKGAFAGAMGAYLL